MDYVEELVIEAQPGLQEALQNCTADIAIIGGSAGGGKTYGMLLDPLEYLLQVERFEVIYFRRTYPEIVAPGSLLPTSQTIYPYFGATLTGKTWNFPETNSRVGFRHLQYEKDITAYQSAQIQAIYFDELTLFTRSQFVYFYSRNRNPTNNGVKPYIRAACNPDPDSWVADLLAWWIDQDELLVDGSANPQYGYPIKERAGVLRYFTLYKGVEVWGNTAQEVIDQVPEQFSGEFANTSPKSITFIPGDIFGNKKLLEQDAGYLGSLLAMPEDDQSRFLRGNWKVRIIPDALFNVGAIASILSNYPPPSQRRVITGDIARFGHDWTVLFAWIGWEIAGCVIMKVNDSTEAVVAIEFLRARFQILETDVLLDQNGVGGDVLALRPNYRGFLNNAIPMVDPVVLVKENYKNLKTQCAYKSADRTNEGALKCSLNNDNVWIYESAVDPTSPPGFPSYKHVIKTGCKTKRGSEIADVRDLIKKDLRCIRKREKDKEGKLQINTKEEQKALNGGWSPDFLDNFIMRELFELTPVRAELPDWDYD